MPDFVFAEILGDLYQFDESEMIWINLTEIAQGVAPIAREGHGFAQASDNKLYVFGGKSREGLNYLNFLPVSL